MKELSELALIGALLLVSLTIVYCADALLQEMAKQRTLMEIEFGDRHGGLNGGYAQGLKSVRTSGHEDSEPERSGA